MRERRRQEDSELLARLSNDLVGPAAVLSLGAVPTPIIELPARSPARVLVCPDTTFGGET